MNNQSIVGIYDRMEQAEAAIDQLNQGGFPITQVSIVAQNLESEKQVHGYITTGDVARGAAGTGAWVGGIFGLLMGAAFVWVPGVGPLLVAGPLAAALLGGIEGAAVGLASGGVLGGIAGWGISRQHILKYEEAVKAGKYLVIARGSADEIARAQTILHESDVTEVTTHPTATA